MVPALGGIVPEPLRYEDLGLQEPTEAAEAATTSAEEIEADAGAQETTAVAPTPPVSGQAVDVEGTSLPVDAAGPAESSLELPATDDDDGGGTTTLPEADGVTVVVADTAAVPGTSAAARPGWMPTASATAAAATATAVAVEPGTTAAARPGWMPAATPLARGEGTVVLNHREITCSAATSVHSPEEEEEEEAKVGESAGSEAQAILNDVVASAPPAADVDDVEEASPGFLVEEPVVAASTAYIEPPRLSTAQREACYSNRLLEKDAVSAKEQFSDEARRASAMHPLWKLLEDYRKLRLAVAVVNTELAELNASVSAAIAGVWQIMSEKAEVSATCDCGNTVSGERYYETAAFDEHIFIQLQSVLNDARNARLVKAVKVMSNARVARYHVEGYLSDATIECNARNLRADTISFAPETPRAATSSTNSTNGTNGTNSTNRADGSGRFGASPAASGAFGDNCTSREEIAQELRECVKVLHWFIRGSSTSVKDNGFAFEVNSWLEHLSAALLTQASLDDHRFLLQAVVRCGAGLNESLVKCLHLPKEAQHWNNGMADHALALLGCMLSQVNPPARGKRATSDLEMVDLFETQLNGADNPDDLRTVGELIQGAKEEGSIADGDLAVLRELYSHRASAINSRGPSPIASERSSTDPDPTISPSDPNSGADSSASVVAAAAAAAAAARKGSGKLGDSHYAALLDCFPLGQLLQFVLRLPMPSGGVSSHDAAHHHGGWRTAGATAAAAPHTDHTIIEVFSYVDALLRVLFSGFTGLGGTQFPLLTLRAGRAVSDIFAGLAHFWETAPALAHAREPRPACGNGVAGEAAAAETAMAAVIISSAHVELDQLFMRTFSWFFSEPLESVWPFIAELPFHVLSPPAAWRVLCFIFTNGNASLGQTPHADWQAFVRQKVHRERFADRLMLMPQRSAEYMLSMLANLARTRVVRPNDADGRALIEAVFFELFAVACLYIQTRDRFLRCVRDQLASIASAHPWVLSTLVRLLEANFSHIGKVAIYILRAMPLNIWQPSTHDILVVQQWLEQPLTSPAHLSAREMVNLLAVNTRPADLTRTGLPPDTHVDLVFAVAHGYRRHTDDAAATGGGQRVNLAMLRSAGITSFEAWCWGVLLTLEPWRTIPVDIDTSVQLDKLKPVARTNPVIACALLLVSTAGRTTRSFEDQGVRLLSVLIEHGNYKAAIYCLTCALPGVVQDSAQLAIQASNATLCGALQVLLEADRSAVPLAGELFFSKDYTIELLLVDMVRSNLYCTIAVRSAQQQRSGTFSMVKMVEFWLRLICSCSGWCSNEVARRLLDVVLAASFACGDGRAVVQGLLETIHADAVAEDDSKRLEARKGVSGVLTWISGAAKYDGDMLSFADEDAGYVHSVTSFFKKSPVLPPGALQPVTLRCVPTCLVFESLIMETRKEAPIRDKVGATLLLGGSTLEKVAKAAKMSSGSFRVFRWAHYCTVLDPEESLLPVFWQLFFALYFASCKGTTRENKCFGNRFFANENGFKLINTLKDRLAFLAEWHVTAASGEASSRQTSGSGSGSGSGDGSTAAAADDSDTTCADHEWSCTRSPVSQRPAKLHFELAQLYTEMVGWLSKDPSALHDFARTPTRPQHLASASNTGRFQSVICDAPWKAAHTLWRDLLPQELDSKAGAFRDLQLSRLFVLAVPTQGTRGTGGGLLKRDRSKDFEGVPCALPLMQPATIDAALIASQSVATNPNLIYQHFSDDLMELNAMSSLYELQVTNVATLDRQYLHAMPALHVNDPQQITQKVQCVKRMGSPCLGAGTVVFELTQQRVVTSVKREMTMNRKEVNAQLDCPPVPDSCNKAAYRVLSRAESLMQSVKQGVVGAKEYAQQLFYRLARNIDDGIQMHPPSLTVYEGAIKILGSGVIADSASEMQALLNFCFEIPERTLLVQPYFNPALCVQAYSSLYEAVSRAGMLNARHIGALLERFHLQEWLDNSMCTKEDRSSFVQVVSAAIVQHVEGAATANLPQDSSAAHILQLHFSNLDLITRDKFPLQYGDVLCSLVTGSSNCAMPDECWMAFLETLVLNQKALPIEEQMVSVQWLEQTFISIRQSSGYLYPIFSTTTVHLCQLYRFLFQSAVTSPSYRLDTIFDMIRMLFRPWLSTLPPSATHGVWQPWPRASDEMGCGRDILDELLRVVGMLTPLDEAMAVLWQFYVDALVPRAEPHVLDVIHATFEKMPWTSLQITQTVLQDMLSILTPNAAASSYLFTVSVLCKANLNWCNVGTGNLQNSDAGKYHERLFAVILRTAAHRAVSQSYDMELFGNVIRSCPWKYLQPDSFAIALGQFERECDLTGMFQGATSTYQGMAVLRCGTAVELADNDSAAVEKFRLYSGLYCRLVQRAGDTVTCENLIWLLKDLMSDIQGSTGRTFKILAESIFMLLNGFRTGTPQSVALINAAVTWVEEEPRHALMLLRVTCTAVVATSEMARLAEACIAQHISFAASRLGPSATTHITYWNEICAHLAVPQIDQVCDNFVNACTKGPFPLTLHAHLLQLLATSTASAADIMNVLAAATRWVEQLAPSSSEASENMFLLWAKVLELAEKANVGGSVSQAVAAQNAVLEVLVRTSEQRSSSGISGFFGLGAFKFSLEIRLFCRTLAASVAGRIANDDLSQKRAVKLLSSIESLKKEVAKKEGGDFVQARLDRATVIQFGAGQQSSNDLIGRMINELFRNVSEVAILRGVEA